MFKDSRLYAIELDGITYTFSGDRIEQIVDLKDIEGDRFFVSDMQEAITRTMTVEAPVRYVEVMVRRKLQESGEFEEPVSIITHWKRRKGKNAADIFFTALPTRLYYQYLDQIKEHEDSVLLFPLYSVLYQALKNIRPQDPVAIVFQHSRFADLIIGTKKRIYYANRCIAFDTSEEQISGLWDMVKTDIRTIETENRIKVARILLLNWIDSGIPPGWQDETEQVYSFEEEAISFSEKEYHISFLKALRMLSGISGISPWTDKTLYYTRRSSPYFNAIFFLGALSLIGGYFWYGQKVDLLQNDLIALEQKRNAIQMETSRETPQLEYKETLAFVRELAFYQRAPSYKEVINDISDARSSDMKVDVLKIDYSKDEMMAEIFGMVQAPFDLAYKGYQGFVETLTKKGYFIKESSFNTEINSSEFLLTFKKRIQ
jgi:hypothetical protein